ncbi:amino acid ABC transporter permease [Methylobacterium sp. ID0610]|uniref:amino acid ABC transporter permease n=1 Tax=Methylobacterium carpenticola TaxID=3344827 RepID=UPI00367ABB3A
MTAGSRTLPLSFIRREPIPPAPAPALVSGPLAWARANLFSSPGNAALTLLAVLIIALVVPPLLRFLVLDAVFTGENRDACRPEVVGRPVGACWAFIANKINYFVYGSYPIEERWRANVFFAMAAIGVGWLLWLDAPRRDLGALYFFVVFPLAAYALLAGLPLAGLPTVPTSLWGGMLVTIVVSIVGIVASLPLGILLALGRRSRLPVVRLVCVIFIEFWRGVPLITVLFMANVMLPLFLPGDISVDRLLRPLVGVALFSAAYMAEVVRGGLQAIPRGQTEGANSLGLTYWQGMRLVILPQALRIVIPGIVNSFIALFKDTTLVSIVGIFDFVRTIESARIDPNWAAPTVVTTGYAFAALFYFVFCFGMSRYALFVERRLAAGQKR